MGAEQIRAAITSRLAAGVSSTAEISRAFGISQPALSRAMRALERDRVVLRIGTTRGAPVLAAAALAGAPPGSAAQGEWPKFNDMLPMLFAPQGEQILERPYAPAVPTAAWLPVWSDACTMAAAYWERLADEPRLSAGFRLPGSQCLDALRSAPHVRLGRA